MKNLRFFTELILHQKMEQDWFIATNQLNIGVEELRNNPLDLKQLEYIEKSVLNEYNLSQLDVQPTISRFEKGHLILEALALKNRITDWNSLAEVVISGLEIPNSNWDWKKTEIGDNEAFYYKLRLLRVLLERKECESMILKMTEVMSYHSHPQLPWSSKSSSSLVGEIIHQPSINQILNSVMDEYINELLRPNLLVISNRNLTTQGRSKASNNLRPKLGYSSSINDETNEENARRNWKNSPRTRSLAMVWFIIQMIEINQLWFNQNWTILTSFVLNLLEDHEVQFKAQACTLLESLVSKLKAEKINILSRSGLLDLFINSTKPCLSYLPNLTLDDESGFILPRAYGALFTMVGDDKKQLIDLLNTTLSSISHLKSTRDANLTMNVLLSLLNLIVKNLDSNVLISMSRINFAINQLLVDPDVAESNLSPLKWALEVQHTILQIFHKHNNAQALPLIFNYRFDFLASWVIVNDRVTDSAIIAAIRSNYDLLKGVSQTLDVYESFHEDVKKIQKTEPKCEKIFI